MKLRHYLAISGVGLMAASLAAWAMFDPAPALAVACIGLVLVGIGAILTPP